jgi:DNA-directed RNA polymerase subunit E'
MYKILKIKGSVRIPPHLFDTDLEEAARRVLEEDLVGSYHPGIGMIVAIINVQVSPEGRLLPGDGGTYHDAVFDVLAYRPVVREVAEGEVVAARNSLAWINLGPLDGVVHISQLMDERVHFDPQRRAFIGEETKRLVEVGDRVRVRVISVSEPAAYGERPRIQLTMRQPYLGKPEWWRRKEQAKSGEEGS